MAYVSREMIRGVYRDNRFIKAKKLCHMRDGNICQMCEKKVGTRSEPAVADHIQRVSQAWELRFDVSNLQTLCSLCHGKWKQIHERNPEIASDANGLPLDESDPWHESNW